MGKLIKEIDPLDKVWEYAYDGNRNRISRRDAKGELTEYVFTRMICWSRSAMPTQALWPISMMPIITASG